MLADGWRVGARVAGIRAAHEQPEKTPAPRYIAFTQLHCLYSIVVNVRSPVLSVHEHGATDGDGLPWGRVAPVEGTVLHCRI